MDVAELIAVLQQLPQDMPVMTHNDEMNSFEPVSSAVIDKNRVWDSNHGGLIEQQFVLIS